MSEDCACARLFTRAWICGRATVACSGSSAIPRSVARRMSVRTPVEAMKVLDGTQSNRTQAPPTPSESIKETEAPCCAATNAASYPAGPPPMITIRVICPPIHLTTGVSGRLFLRSQRVVSCTACNRLLATV
ncbi:hypothetical protein MLGJGCBP_00368 [Rhodococcus sp. T7]|nr:hypothetical protein MLGJGCBP_00368 [Rhodococcus sp. T7]